LSYRKIVKVDNSLKDKTVKIPKTQVKNPKRFVAYSREIENFSTTNVIAGSISDIDEVIAAKNNKIKNAVDIKMP
jgi:hypothetical protein